MSKVERFLSIHPGVPNSVTKKAISELEKCKGKSFESIEAFMADLNLKIQRQRGSKNRATEGR